MGEKGPREWSGATRDLEGRLVNWRSLLVASLLPCVAYLLLYHSSLTLAVLGLPIRNYNLILPDYFHTWFEVPYTFEVGTGCLLLASWLFLPSEGVAAPSSPIRQKALTTRVEALREAGVLLGVVVVFMYLDSRTLTDPAYALRGIESGFYNWARGLLHGSPPCQPPCCRERVVPEFWSPEVYCDHPLGLSYFQMISLYIFGPSLWSWRFSTVFLSVSGAIPLYLLMRTTGSRAAACCALTVYLCSYYHFQWAQMGYNNIYFITPML